MGDLKLDQSVLDMMDQWYELFGTYPDPRELALLDIDAFHAFFAHRQGIGFMRDYAKRPANMQ